MSSSSITWAICKSAPCLRQITMPAPHHSVFYRPDALPAAQQRESTEGIISKHNPKQQIESCQETHIPPHHPNATSSLAPLYKFSEGACRRVSTNLTQQISRRFQEGFQEKSRTCLRCFGLLCNVPNLLNLMEHVMTTSKQCSSLCYSTNYNISYIFNIAWLNVQ